MRLVPLSDLNWLAGRKQEDWKVRAVDWNWSGRGTWCGVFWGPFRGAGWNLGSLDHRYLNDLKSWSLSRKSGGRQVNESNIYRKDMVHQMPGLIYFFNRDACQSFWSDCKCSFAGLLSKLSPTSLGYTCRPSWKFDLVMYIIYDTYALFQFICCQKWARSSRSTLSRICVI